MRAPLEDPAYVPEHPPINGDIPDVVAKWGARSQLRWFDRYRYQLKPQKPEVWGRFHCNSEAHLGQCCWSCIDDMNSGYGDDIEGCCCLAIRDEWRSRD